MLLSSLHLYSQRTKWLQVLLILAFMALPAVVSAQQQNLIVEDTTTATFVINPDFPQSAAVVLYSPLSNLAISSAIEFLDTSYSPQRGEYIFAIRPNTAYMLTIEYPGFQAYELRVPPIDTGESRSFIVKPPAPFISGTLVIEATPSDAEIQVQGIEIGQGAIQLALRPGIYPIRISREGYDPLEFSAEISLNESNVQRRAITPAKQPLSVTSNVDRARVFYEGQEIGVAPVTDFLVEQGLAEIRVESPGYAPFVRMVDIRSDRNNVVEATLQTQIQMLRASSIYVQNESVTIEDNTLEISYDLASEKKRYNVDIVFLGPDNQPVDVAGLRGDFGKKQTPGEGRVVYWPIPQGFSLDGIKVQVDARPQSNMGWYLLGGGLGIGGGVAIAVLTGGDDPGANIASRPPGRP